MQERLLLVAAAFALVAGNACAETTVTEAWVRATVPQQKASGLFAKLVSSQGGRLVAGVSPVAGVVEIHEMVMDGNVMRMRALANGLELPAGKTVELKPGGYHVMLLDLKQQLKPGDSVPLTLTVEGADGRKETVELKAPVRALGAPMMQEMPGQKR